MVGLFEGRFIFEKVSFMFVGIDYFGLFEVK